MKLFALNLTFCASETLLAPVTPPPLCPDLDKNEICSTECSDDRDICYDDCGGDYSCVNRCNSNWLNCLESCPCSSGCPDGCAGCPHPVCQATEQYLFMINYSWASENKSLHLKLSDDTFIESNFNYHYDFMDVDDACVSYIKGQHFFIGGYYNPRAIIKVVGCEFKMQPEELVIPHIGGMWGSCETFNDVAKLCFYEDGVGSRDCQTFDSESEIGTFSETTYPHDWSDMAVYDDKMWVVGGCDPDDFSNCHNHVEYYVEGDYSWQTGSAHPSSQIYGGVVLGDASGVYTFGGRGGDNARSVFRMRNGSWSFLGQMSEAAAYSYYFTSGKIVGDYAYVGENSFEKVSLEDGVLPLSTNIGPETDDLRLYYAAMILTDQLICMD